jgi:hypothetical protein
VVLASDAGQLFVLAADGLSVALLASVGERVAGVVAVPSAPGAADAIACWGEFAGMRLYRGGTVRASFSPLIFVGGCADYALVSLCTRSICQSGCVRWLCVCTRNQNPLI